MSKMIRQGDVLMVPISKIPSGAKLEKGRKTVAWGEAIITIWLVWQKC
jgi:hypothetical protein